MSEPKLENSADVDWAAPTVEILDIGESTESGADAILESNDGYFSS